MEQFEQLLTCCVCLDRYRIPKLLPCQHSFCMEPCMEGLVDYVRRQVKCPECRAEHRIPYNGVQAFPTNVTLQRFLELHIEITGELPDPTSGQIMERCGVCSEKAYLSHCAHCEKKICEDCKSAHMDILRREITRFNSQIRRSLHRLQDSLAIIEKNTMSLQTNAISVTEEIDEIYQRITKAIKDRSDQLKGEIDRYLAVELRNLTTLKENLDLEITNITSNCDTVDKYMNETVEWDDCELMDTKEIFLKTVEFLRHFEYENNDYSRRVRFLVSIDPNQLVMNLATFGDLNIAPHSTPSGGSVSSSHLAPPSALQPGLMRSKSDHRLATQFRQQEERSGYNDEPVLGGRKFGERPQRSATQANNDRYGRSGGDYDYENDYDNDGSSGRAGKSSRFRSRFVRSHQNDDSDSEQQQQQRQQELKERKDRVLDSEDVSRGQLSGIIRLSDCSRVVQRLADIGKEKKEKKSDAAAAAQAAVQAAIQAQKAAMQRQQQKNQQTAAAADEEELARQKRKNAGSSSTGGAATSTSSGGGDTASDQRVAALKNRGGEESDGSSNQAASPVRSSAASTTRAESKPPVSAQVAAVKKTQRSGSSDSSASTESSASSAAAAAATSTSASATAAAPATSSSNSTSQNAKAPSSSRYSTARDATAVPEKKPFVSRFLPQHSTANATNGSADKKKAESSSSSEEETSSESESESEPETKAKSSAASSSTNTKSTPSSAASSTTAASSSTTGGGSYRDRLEARRASRDDSSSTAAGRSSYATPSSSGYGSGSGTTGGRTRAVPAPHHTSESEDRYGSGTGSSALPFSIPYISRPSRARYRKRLADV
ncbi:E3 ubiquitin-protein ligase Arkadia isoform X9 [Drosophila yakuba]|uniref:E3 ubiquitin-protein ligase Arkadia isoform X9 n=1 Tax=Drosophila yakuba TaxID=7245 RepID=UPI0019308663|nr:E3 ubiquitin-protein ligase Arkadia isoform X9 [Drosophila yakuba]